VTDRLLSVDEIAIFLGVKRDTVYKLIDRNSLPGFKVGRLWKFRRAEIDTWLDNQPGRKHSVGENNRPTGREKRG
jgi:excisionase family DNA binding protein